ncbi:acetyl-CoA carboxylase biotin carboxyl carrier protein [Phaeovulum sp. W22_SRMD_FR3]|uniref:acetyl-CoA carboxylase biotin carboxyl carrier protein n=1 Tax=Phaeovulum sp. W22_SRMD_FR3 TaxID=3240274 RepID=UPI003F9D68F0
MDLPYLKTLIDWMADSGLSEFELVQGKKQIRLTRGSLAPIPAHAPDVPPRATPAKPAAEAAGAVVCAPLSGLCHLAPEPGAAAFVKPGDRVQAGQTLCVIEAMKLMTEVTAPTAGTVAEILTGNGADVSAGTPLIRVVA